MGYNGGVLPLRFPYDQLNSCQVYKHCTHDGISQWSPLGRRSLSSTHS